MKRFSNILVVVNENCSTVDPAVQKGIELAQSHGARLTLMSVIDPPGRALAAYKGIFKPEELIEMKIKQRKDALEEFGLVFKDIEINVHVAAGKDFIEIIRFAVYEQHDLLIKTVNTPHDGFDSSDFHLMRKCPVPVWLYRSDQSNKGATAGHKVLAAVDLNQEAEEEGKNLNSMILDFASLIAQEEGSELHLLSCWSLYGEESLRSSPFMKISRHELEKMLEQERELNETAMRSLIERYPEAVIEGHLLKGQASELIPDFVHDNEIDIIVMGTVARTGIPGLLIGNTAETILSKIDCSVVTLKPSGFQSIIK